VRRTIELDASDLFWYDLRLEVNMPARVYFEVRPRYTAGSPGMVDEDTAKRLAEEERRSHGYELEGIYGEDRRAEAEKRGLKPEPRPNEPCFTCQAPFKDHDHHFCSVPHAYDGPFYSVVEELTEHTNHWLVRDLCTGEVYQRHFSSATLRGRQTSEKCPKCLAARERARAEQK
jgi:hypothetical protein